MLSDAKHLCLRRRRRPRQVARRFLARLGMTILQRLTAGENGDKKEEDMEETAARVAVTASNGTEVDGR